MKTSINLTMSIPFLSCYILKVLRFLLKKTDLVIIIQRCHEVRDS